jgi:signal peptidase I
MDHVTATPAPLPLGRPIRRRFGWHLAALGVIVVIGLWLGMHKTVTQYTVTSGSMEPTLRVGESLGAESHGGVKIGDIVVFHPPAGARPVDPVSGLGTEGSGSTRPCGLPAGDYYLLGDNRGASDDSRFWGPVPGAWIIGTVVRCSLLNTVCRPLR